MIPVSDCKIGYLYSLRSRNLTLGVFTISNTFIGIRQKFDDRFLDYELHHDKRGTATPLLELGKVPEYLSLETSLGTKDHISGRKVKFDKPVSDGGKGWYFIDTGESNKEIRPVRIQNNELFQYLDQKLKELKEEEHDTF